MTPFKQNDTSPNDPGVNLTWFILIITHDNDYTIYTRTCQLILYFAVPNKRGEEKSKLSEKFRLLISPPPVSVSG